MQDMEVERAALDRALRAAEGELRETARRVDEAEAQAASLQAQRNEVEGYLALINGSLDGADLCFHSTRYS